MRFWTCLTLLLGLNPVVWGVFPVASEESRSEVVLVATQGANRLALIEPGAEAPRQIVRVEEDPTGLALGRDGELAAILHTGESKGGQAVTFFSLALGRVLRVVDLADENDPGASLFGPCAAVFEPDGAHLLLSVESSSTLYRISVEDGSIVPLLDLGASGASDMVLSKDGRLAWASFSESGTLVVCDLVRDRVSQRIALGGGTSRIALHPGGHELWAVNALTNSVSVVDLAESNEVLEFPVGSQPWSLDFTPDGSQVLVIHRHGASATLLDSERRMVTAEIQLGPDTGNGEALTGRGALPSAVSIASDGRTALVTLEGTNELLTLGLSPLTIERRRPIGQRPTAVRHALLRLPSGL